MPTLHLLRHAKSGSEAAGDDHQRALTRRGVIAARLVGRNLPAATGPLDLVLCSSARRARRTMELALAAYPEPPRVAIEEALYLATRNQLLARLRRLSEADRNVLLIGHNPGLHELALALAAAGSPAYAALASDKFPTAARASFRIETPWRALGEVRHELLAYITPSSLGEPEE